MRFKVFVLALVALCATSALASAQSQTGEIFGKATDASGAVLPGVVVTIRNAGTNIAREAVTEGNGRYRAAALQPGRYQVTGACMEKTTPSQSMRFVPRAEVTQRVTGVMV